MESLLPSASSFLDAKQLGPFYSYCLNIPAARNMLQSRNVTKMDFEAECRIFKRISRNENVEKFHNERQTVDLSKLCMFMMKIHADTAPTLTVLYRVATTAGFASACVESLFSSLSQMDVPKRRSMGTKREADLTYLYFENKTLMSVTYNEFLDVWRQKPRRLEF